MNSLRAMFVLKQKKSSIRIEKDVNKIVTGHVPRAKLDARRNLVISLRPGLQYRAV